MAGVNDYYTDAQEVRLTTARAELQNTERAAVEAAFDKLPTAAAFKTRNIYYAIAGALEDATYTVTLSTPTPTAYDKGFRIDLEVQVANTGASTINANGLGAKQIQNPDGTALAANTLLTGVIYPLIYNGTVFKITFEAADTIPADESVTVAKLAASIYADQSEAEAGTENTKLMTALRTKQGFTSYGMLKATYDAAAIAEQLVGLSATQTLTNKTLTTPTLTLKQGAAPTPTAEGDIQWDTDDDKIVIGDGAGQKVFVPTAAVSGDVTMDTAGAVAIAAGVIVNADVNASAAIALSKLAALTASRLAVTDGSGFLAVSSVTATEAGYLSGVTSAIQTQLDAKQASDAELTAIAGLTSAADKVPYFTGSGAAAVADFTSVARTLVAQATQALMLTTGLGLSANGASLVAAANYAAMRALLDLEAGTDFNAYDATLASLAALGTAADKIAYTTGVDTWAEAALTAAARSILDDTTVGAIATTLGLGTGDSPQLAAVNIGHASDTTVDRAAAGFIQVEGKRVPSPASQAQGDVLYRGATEWERLAAGTSGFFLMTNGAAANPAYAYGLLGAGAVHYVAGNYYWFGSIGSNTFAVTADTIYASPANITRTATFDRIVLEVTTGVVGNVRLGIYDHDYATGLPGTLVLDAGTATTDAAAVKEVTISQQLTPGRYWLVAVFDAAPTCRRYNTTSNNALWFGFGTTDNNPTGSTGMQNCVSAAFTYAALAASFPGSPSRISDQDSIRLGLRAA